MFFMLQNEGHTPLHISAWEGDESMIKYLQSCKANPNIIDKVIVKRATDSYSYKCEITSGTILLVDQKINNTIFKHFRLKPKI